MSDRQIKVRVSEELHEELQQAAHEKGCSVNAEVVSRLHKKNDRSELVRELMAVLSRHV